MVNGRRLFRLSGYLDGISPRSFFLRVLYISSDIFYPVFLLTSLSLSKLSAGSGWLWLGVLPVLSKPLAGPVWVVCGWWGPGKGFYLQASLLIWPEKTLWQFCCRYTNALFFSFAVFLDRVQWGSFLLLLYCSKRPLSSSALLVETNNVCLQTALPSKAFIVFWPPKSMLHSNSFRLALKIIMLVL